MLNADNLVNFECRYLVRLNIILFNTNSKVKIMIVLNTIENEGMTIQQGCYYAFVSLIDNSMDCFMDVWLGLEVDNSERTNCHDIKKTN